MKPFAQEWGTVNDSGKVSRRFPTFFPISHDGAMAVVVGVENVVILTFGRLLDGGRIMGWKWHRGQLRPSLTLRSAFLHLWPSCCWVFLARQRKPLVELRVQVRGRVALWK